MGTSSSSDLSLETLRDAVRGDGRHPGLAFVLPLLQTRHRRELRREEHWSKEELVRHPDPRQLIRAMRKPGNLNDRGLPIYTLDERRYSTADIRENQMVRAWTMKVRGALERRAETDPRAEPILRQLERAIGRAPFLADVGPLDPRERMSTTMLQDPLYRSVVALRV